MRFYWGKSNSIPGRVVHTQTPKIAGDHGTCCNPNGDCRGGFQCHVFPGEVRVPDKQINRQPVIGQLLGEIERATGKAPIEMTQVQIGALDN